MERESKNVDFVRSRGSVRYEDDDGHTIEKTYFNCNRSGKGLEHVKHYRLLCYVVQFDLYPP